MLELVVEGETLEVGTVDALLTEIELRVGLPEMGLIVPPCTSHLFSSEDLGEDAPTVYENKDQDEWKARIREAEHLFIVVHSEAPSHYTFLEVHKIGEVIVIEHRDSLKDPSKRAHEAATRILRRLKLIGEAEECPATANEAWQVDGWSCGLWAARWCERSLRELRGEARARPFSIKDCVVRGNEFIAKIKAAGLVPKAKAKAEAKAEPTAKPEKVYKVAEPIFDTLEEALEAGKKCTKCLPTKFGTKGCRACMGEHFEQIRMKHFKSSL